MSETTATKDVAEQVRTALKWIGSIAGSAVGFGALAFSCGFLAQRAQYDLVQVPFVFIDYWAYAETGTTAVIQSLTLMVSSPLALLFMASASIAVVILLEAEAFRRRFLHAHWAFLGYVVVILGLGLILLQQLSVRSLRSGSPEVTVERTGLGASPRETVPAIFPFTLAVARPAMPPQPDELAFPEGSFAMWEKLADELERTVDPGAVYLDVRPRPSWALVPSPASPGSPPESQHVSGLPVPPRRLDAARAIQLYRALVVSFLLALWAVLVCGSWQERILETFRGRDPGPPSGRLAARFARFREEIWFASRWILRPIAVAMLAISGLFLMPEAYGILAMPRLGQELVEVVTNTKDSGSSSEAAPSPAARGPRRDFKADTFQALNILKQFSRDNYEKPSEEWRLMVAAVAADASVEAAGTLEMMANASSAVSSELSDLAQEALTGLSAKALAVRQGFLLHYPRSDVEYLRILHGNSGSKKRRWTIQPVKVSEVLEIRVKKDERTIRLVEILKGLRQKDAEERARALYETEVLGHPRLLEVALAGTYDPSPTIRAFSMTDIGQFGAALADTPGDRFRRDVARGRLLQVIADRREREDIRAKAVTSLNKFLPPGDERACEALREMLEATGEGLGDLHWEVRGVAITSAGLLLCRQAVPALLKVVVDPSAPVHVRATIPTTLRALGTQESSAETLAALLQDREAPMSVVGTSISAIARLAGEDVTLAVDSLCRFLVAESYGTELVEYGQVSEYRQTAIDSLRSLGDRRAGPTMVRLAQRSLEPDEEVRRRAIFALKDLEHPEAEELLCSIAEDRQESVSVRAAAVDALERYYGDKIVWRLVKLYDQAPVMLKQEILGTLDYRAYQGSGLAGQQANLLRQRPGSPAVPPRGERDEPREGGPVNDRATGVRTVSVGEARSGVLGESGQKLDDGSMIEVFALDLAAGGSASINVLTDEFDSVLIVTGPGLSGPQIDDDSGGRCNPRVNLVNVQGGRYVIGVSALQGKGAGQRFVVRADAEPGPKLEGGCNLAN